MGEPAERYTSRGELNSDDSNCCNSTSQQESNDNQQNHSTTIEKSLRLCCCCGEYCTRLLKNITSHPAFPSWRKVARIVALFVLGFLIWGSAYSMLGFMAGPNGLLFRIGILGVLAHFSGWLVSLFHFPPLLGMLLMGILLRNVGFVILSSEFLVVMALVRQMSLVVIMIRAGLGLDGTALKKLGFMVTKLAIVPSLGEICLITVLAYYFLDLPWLWGFLLGTVIAPVSPAVVIPNLFSLQDRGYGKSKGIPTLIVAAASFDDIIGISVFGVILSVIFSTGSLTTQIIRGPIGIVIGLFCGISLGYLLRYIPDKGDNRVTLLRTFLLGCGGILFMFGSVAVGYDGAGPLGGIVASFIASNGWKSTAKHKAAIADNFAVIWAVFEPILFGLIGSEIDLFSLDGLTVGIGLAIIIVAVIGRIGIAILAATCGNLNWKEKVFVSFAWFPKATVQAAIGPVALDTARQFASEDGTAYANTVLILAVLSILVTAPFGAALITFMGPRLLKKQEETRNQQNEQVMETIQPSNGQVNASYTERD